MNLKHTDAGARLASLAMAWDRRAYERLTAANRARLTAASNVQLDAVVGWLNDNEPHVLRDALNGAGVA